MGLCFLSSWDCLGSAEAGGGHVVELARGSSWGLTVACVDFGPFLFDVVSLVGT